MFILDILKEAWEREVSDIILTTWNYPCLKIDGEIFYMTNYSKIEKEFFHTNVFSLLTESQRSLISQKKELDFSMDVNWYWRFRVNAFNQKNGYGLVIRPIKSVLPKFEDLSLPSQVLALAKRKSGLVLVTWAVWTWKTTTLASFINYINQNFKKHIITIEDPIEYVFTSDKSLIEQREVWVNTLSFDNWLKYALRQAPDVIMIWEMRDLETFKLALRAAETGNLVFATLHTSWTSRTVSRVIDMFPADERDQIRQQLSESLVWVVRQDLVKRKDKEGRIPTVEILINNTNVANVIRKWATHQLYWAIETWSADWMITMNKYLEFLFQKWIISEQVYNDNLKVVS